MEEYIPLRAEDINYRTLEKLLDHLKYVTGIIILLKESNILEIPAPKGIGKTLNVFGAFNTMVKLNPELLPISIGFDPIDGKIKIHNLKCYINEEHLEKRDYLLDLNPKELVKEADIISFDNIHYVCDLAKENIVSSDVMDIIAKVILDEIDEGKKIILPTESELKCYLNIANEDGEFVELVEFIEKDKYFQRMYMLPPSVDELCKIYNVELSKDVKTLWNKFSDNLPRSFVNMINLFGRKITMKDIIHAVYRKFLSKYLANEKKLRSISRYEYDFFVKLTHNYEVFELTLQYYEDSKDIYKYIDDIVKEVTGYTLNELNAIFYGRKVKKSTLDQLYESLLEKISKHEIFKDSKGKQLERVIKNLLKLCIKGRLYDVILSIFIENINVGSYYLELAREIALENMNKTP